ncbi:hypothetical protein [Nocardioides stalactiti]|uniref:hypothetical protein n=1 Tax=Nocardioides stalactiti TaxID=2755356 RepID=UPI001601AC95|nr:hypothetical protein [Nocardioides stalactiti]
MNTIWDVPSLLVILAISLWAYFGLVKPSVDAARERRALRERVAERGWSYAKKDKELRARLSSPPFGGRSGWTYDVVSWVHRGRDVRLFGFDEGSGEGSWAYAVAMIGPIAHDLPTIRIHFEVFNPFKPKRPPAEGLHAVPSADPNFVIVSSDPLVAERLQRPLIDLLRASSTLTFLTESGAILLVGESARLRGWVQEPEEIVALLDALAGVVGREVGDQPR